jgi:predicted nucleotidyltransferase
MKIHPDFRDLLAEFAEKKVEALVIGGYAVAFHDRPRYTKDIDLWIGPDDANLQRASDALRAFSAPPEIVRALRESKPDEVIWMGVPPLRIDLLRAVTGVSFHEAWPRRAHTTWDGVEVDVIGLEDLILAKRAAGREHDLADLKRLEQLRTR